MALVLLWKHFWLSLSKSIYTLECCPGRPACHPDLPGQEPSPQKEATRERRADAEGVRKRCHPDTLRSGAEPCDTADWGCLLQLTWAPHLLLSMQPGEAWVTSPGLRVFMCKTGIVVIPTSCVHCENQRSQCLQQCPACGKCYPSFCSDYPFVFPGGWGVWKATCSYTKFTGVELEVHGADQSRASPTLWFTHLEEGRGTPSTLPHRLSNSWAETSTPWWGPPRASGFTDAFPRDPSPPNIGHTFLGS